MLVKSLPQRETIWQELHARPYVHFSAPAHVLHLSFLTSAGSEERERADLARLKEGLGLEATYEASKHCILAASLPHFGRFVVCWARHSEFVRLTFFLYELERPSEPFGVDLRELLPGDWLASLGAPPLMATRICVVPEVPLSRMPDDLAPLFEGHTLNGSRVMGGRADAWSCFRSHDDGFGRIALVVRDMSPRDLGRTLERLLDIEDFYHLVLLHLPLAAEAKAELAAAEKRTVHEMDAVRGASALGEKRIVLDALLDLAVEVEHLRARVASRFAAAAAYFSLLESRFVELREEKIEHVLTLSRFVMRRVRPAAETYQSLSRRLDGLSERIDRASQLLRTSIELNVEEQSRRLLESADRRSRLQLRLQRALESLSVVVIAYYALGLVGYGLKGLKSAGVRLDLDILLGLALPVILLGVWAAVHTIRRRFGDRP